MVDRDPREELADLLRKMPSFLRKILTDDWSQPLTDAEIEEYGSGDWVEWQKLYEKLLERLPEERKRYNERQKKSWEEIYLVKGYPGRPRKDNEADIATALKRENKTWAEIGRILGKSKDAVRSLVRSRQCNEGGGNPK